MNAQGKIKLFGKIGLADFCVILVGAGTCSNIASQFTRDPQSVVYLGYGGMLLGALASRYLMVSILERIGSKFERSPKKGAFVKLAYLVVFIALAATFALSKISLDQHIKGSSSHKQNSGAPIEDLLPEFANQLNAKLPMMIDADTRLDSVMGVNKTLRYNYTLVNYSASNVTEQDVRGAMQQSIENSVCTRHETLSFIKNGATLSYAYFGNEGKQIAVISVSPAQCGNI